MANLEAVDTVAIVMMENRSFDHMLGHLSLPAFGGRDDVEGLQGELSEEGELVDEQYANFGEGTPYYPFLFEEDRPLSGDVPHDREEIQTQLGSPGVTGEYPMNGFVKAYFDYQETTRTEHPLPMGFFGPDHVPITTFFAVNYLVCDHWFCSLPASTQPNKLIALAGDTTIDVTKPQITDELDLVIDWADDRGVSWRVYSDYISLFMLFDTGDLLDHPNFRPLEELGEDIRQSSPDEFPDLVIIEPDYQSVPHPPDMVPNDNHAPLPVRNGERFLRRVYSTLTADPDIWASMVMIYTYDEHGGFWDHVSPPSVRYEPPPDADFDDPFESLGPRVPGLIVSPLVEPGSVFSGRLDHTSVLQFVAEALAPEDDQYSESVTDRLQKGGLHSLSEALNRETPRDTIPEAPSPPSEEPLTVEELRRAGFEPGSEPVEQAMWRRCEQLLDEHPDVVRRNCRELLRWQDA